MRRAIGIGLGGIAAVLFSDKAKAFNRCVVDAMYPDPELERKNRR
jgi:hypothetical protein